MGAPSEGMLTPNSKVSRTANIQVNSGSLARFLSRVTTDTPAVPLRLLFTNDGVSCWTMNAGKTLMVMLDNEPLDDYKVKEPCVLVCNPKELGDMVRSKGKGEVVRIKTAAGEAIVVSTKGRGGVEVMPADEDDCMTIPDRNTLPISDGKRLFPMFDNEPATSEALLTNHELRKALSEMVTANAPYVVMTLGPKSEARSGHWNGKTNRSWTPLTATVSGPEFTVSFTDSLKTLIGVLRSEETPLKVSKHHKGQFVVVETLSEPFITIVATEAIKEV